MGYEVEGIFWTNLVLLIGKCDSPVIESRYRKFIAAVRDEDVLMATEEDKAQHPEEVMDDFHAWIIAVFEPIFQEVAPHVLPFFDPAKIAAGDARPLLSEYLFPEEYCCRLEAENNKPFPIHARDPDSPFVPALNATHPELAQELGHHVKIL